MLCVAPDRPVDQVVVEMLRHIDDVARELGVEYFVTGATARDILLDGVYGLDTGRATRDVDLAIALDGWQRFEALKERLVDTTKFAPDNQVIHRLFYLGRRGHSLDLIPFGRIEEPAAKIAWPPDRSIIMDVTGYREAFAAAQAVEIQPDFSVRVVSLPGLAILKLFAWADRGATDPRDAGDFAALLHQYSAAGNEDRLYGPEIEVLETLNYDVDLAGARLLGRDAARITTSATRDLLLALLSDAGLGRLVRDMARATRAFADPIATLGQRIAQFKAGLQEV